MSNAANLEGPRPARPYANKKSALTRIKANWQLYLLVLLPVAYIIVFNYVPMYGAQIAFKNFRVTLGINGSEWVGLQHFIRFFKSFEFPRLMGNTIIISLYSLAVGFPFPIILALLLNYMANRRYRKAVQMVTYAPYFISTVVMVGMILQFLSPQVGLVNNIIKAFGGVPVNFMGKAEYFRHLYVWTGVWQFTGFNSIIYIAALAGIDPQLHEAALVDGASKLKRIWHVDMPGIMPTAVILLILNCGYILSVGFDKVFLMQNPINLRVSEIISTYVYKTGLASQSVNYSYPAAIGLFQSVVGFIMLILVNNFAKRFSETSLW